MTDYISRADAIEAVRLETAILGRGLLNKSDIISILEALPSADAVQGEWIRKVKEYNDCDGHCFVYWYECSVCGARTPKDQWRNEWHSNYCPSCGARMKGGAE